jgi:ribosomal protein S27AE
MFSGRELVVATKHQKEKVIAPIIEHALGVKCIVPGGLDTDLLGTFSGEVERVDDPIATARKKCLMAMEQTHATLAVASEGSFGPHPSLFFVPADEEFLFFMDRENDLEIIVREISTETNFNKKEISTREELDSFAHLAGFPSHGLILKSKASDHQDLIKGIQDWDELYQAFDKIIDKASSVHVETDMRAFCNPTRMRVIEKAAIKLVEKIKSVCPNCSTPGFGITDHREGLPCSWCGSPTRSTLSYIYSCTKCSFFREENYPNGKKEEDPMYCDRCNP